MMACGRRLAPAWPPDSPAAPASADRPRRHRRHPLLLRGGLLFLALLLAISEAPVSAMAAPTPSPTASGASTPTATPSTPSTATATTPPPFSDADAAVLNATSNDTVTLLATSDLSALFYRHFNSGVIVAPLALPNASALPSEVAARLEPLGLAFDQLDGFLQRALLWDAGYIYSPASSSSNSGSSSSTTARTPFLRVYTRNGAPMASIAPSRNDMERAGCSVQICTSDAFGSTLRAVSCQNQNQVFSVVQCAIDVRASGGGAALAATASDGRQRAVWTSWNNEDRGAIQGLNKTELAAPDVNVGQYEWSPGQETRSSADAEAGSPPTVRLLAIHTVAFSDEPPVGQCPQSRTDARGDLLPTLTIPCAPYDAVAGSGSTASSASGRRLASAEWAPPQESKLIQSWLKSVAPKSAVTAPSPVGGAKPATPGANKPNGNSQEGARSPSSSSEIPGQSTRVPTGGGNGFNMINLVPILVGALALIAVAVGFVIVRKRKNAKHNGRGMDYGPYSHNPLMKADDAYFDGSAFLSPAPGIGATGASSASGRSGRSRQLDLENDFHSSNDSNHSLGRSTKSHDPEVTRASSDRRRKMSKSLMMTNLRRVISEPSSGATAVSRPSLDSEHLKLLQTDPNLSASRISYDKIVFERVISLSSRYEVWLCQYEGEELAVKRLTQRPALADLDEELSLASASAALESEDANMANAVEAFVAEIQITAALEHPNLARFVGVAWARLPADSLCLAMEYQTNGDLRTYIAEHRDQLTTWNRLKMRWAKGVASGLKYLHNQRPVVLHLELNSTHVLLSDRLQPKLIDFGERLSAEDWTQLRISGDAPVTSNLSLLQQQLRNFPYWAAPEVLRGEGHLMASDVYSFGMLLVELDACKLPFQDAKNTSSGGKLKPFQMMNMVISGRLIPSVTSACPDEIRAIVERCTDLVPGRRPKMPEVARMLELADHEMLL